MGTLKSIKLSRFQQRRVIADLDRRLSFVEQDYSFRKESLLRLRKKALEGGYP